MAHGKIDLRPKLLDLNAILQDALESCAPLIEAKRHHVETDLNAAPLVVNGDPIRLSQLFANLINNAAKYTPPNGRIEVSSKMEGGNAVVCVRDTGIGVPPDMLPHLFELFFQVDRDNDVGQREIGVGLALTRSLVQLHGGSIDAFSEGLGKGAQFVVRLPLAEVPPIGDPPKSTTTALAAPRDACSSSTTTTRSRTVSSCSSRRWARRRAPPMTANPRSRPSRCSNPRSSSSISACPAWTVARSAANQGLAGRKKHRARAAERLGRGRTSPPIRGGRVRPPFRQAH